MDAKARTKLIDGLATAKNFDASFKVENRRWMIGKLIDQFDRGGATDAAITTRTSDTLKRALKATTKNRDLQTGFKVPTRKERGTERTLRPRRVEILNGLIAHTPEFADLAHEPQFLFIARRRYRVIERFQFFVNPNGRGYFLYPEDCKKNKEWRVNLPARQDFWEATVPGFIPIVLKTPTNPPDILAAIDVLFQPLAVCNANLLDCEATLSILYMDSLRVARNPKQLLEALYAKGATHLCIGRATRPPIFSADTSAEGLFSIADRPQADICVGDHVYIFNHGLYKVLVPEGSWQGEHAVVTDCGDRGIVNATGFKFMGHGLPHGGEPGSLPRFYSNRLNELNTALSRSYRTGGIFLHYMKSGGTAFPGSVTKETHTLAGPGGVSNSTDFYLFDLAFNYPAFKMKPSKGTAPAKIFEHGFVAWHIAATRQFGIHRKATIAEAVTSGLSQASNRAIFKRENAPATAAEMFDNTEWSIPYPAPGNVQLPWKVFQKKGAGVEIKKLEMADVFKQPFFRFGTTNTTEMWMARPKVDVGNTYTAFLTAKGAI